MDDVEFYEKHVQFQEKVGKIQDERARLERQFYSMVQSNKNLQSLKALKLRSYWKQICDRERKARERNAELLRDFAETEAKIAALQAQSAKLRKMKKQYEDEVAKLYPKWRQQVEFARAQKQLQEKGIHVTNQAEPQPSWSAPSSTYRPTATSNPTTSVAVTNVQEALFKLVPVATNQTSPPIASAQTIDVLVQPTPESALVPGPRPDAFNRTVPDSVQDDVSETEPKQVAVPPLDLPSSAERDRSDLTDPYAGDSNAFASPAQATVKRAEPSATSSRNVDPTPVTPTRLFAAASTVHQIRVKSQSPSDLDSDEGPVKDFISDIGSESSKDRSIVEPLPENNPFAAKVNPAQGSSLPKDRVLPSLVNAPPGKSSPRHTALPQTKIVVPSPGRYNETSDKPENVDSILSESLTTDNTSPRADAPLTSSAAYQNLIKSHDPKMSSTLGGSGFYEDEDELEDVLSPKEHHSLLSEASTEPDSAVKASPVVHIPTATQNSDITTSSKDQQDMKPQNVKKSKKAPWDTDSDEEEDSFDSRHQAGGGQLDDDDFDFYD